MTVHPVPRPARRAKKPRAHNSTIPRAEFRSAATAKKLKTSAPRKRNPARQKRDWPKAYLSPEFVQFVQTRPCAVCGVVGYSEAAHTRNGERKGMSQKRSWKAIAPLCGPRPTEFVHAPHPAMDGMMDDGCHYHEENDAAFRERYAERIREAIVEVQALWQARTA